MDNIGEARVLANKGLDALNQTRKEIEQGMQVEALTLCEKLERSSDTLPGGGWQCITLNGIRALLAFWAYGSVSKSVFTVRLSPLRLRATVRSKGSGRSIQGLHMRDALERLAEHALPRHDAEVWRSCGWRRRLSLEEDKFELFQQRFGELVTEWLDPSLLQGEVVSDGPLSPAENSHGSGAAAARCWPVGGRCPGAAV